MVLASAGVAVVPARADCPPPAGDMSMLVEPAVRCREPAPDMPPFRIGVEALAGTQRRDVPLNGVGFGVAIPIDVALTRVVGVGARLGYQVAADAGRDDDGDGRDDDNRENHRALLLVVGPRIVLHTEAARSEAWRVEASGGWLGVLTGDGSSGPIAELAFGRQVGSFTVDHSMAGHGTGTEAALTLRLQQGFGGASDYRALLVGATLATEMWARLPEGSRPRRTRPDVEHTFGGGIDMGVAMRENASSFVPGASLYVGLPFGRVIEARAQAELFHVGGEENRDGADVVAFLGGVHLGRWFPVFLEVLGGYGLTASTRPGPVGDSGLFEITAGLQLPNLLGCGVGQFVGQRTRVELGSVPEGRERLVVVGAVIGLSYDSLVRAAECWP